MKETRKEGGREEGGPYLGSRADDEAMVLRNDVQQLLLREADLVIHFVATLLEDLDAHLGRGRRKGGREGSCV